MTEKYKAALDRAFVHMAETMDQWIPEVPPPESIEAPCFTPLSPEGSVGLKCDVELPQWMRWISSENRYDYLSSEDSARLKQAIQLGECEVANLLIRIAKASHAAHCTSRY